MKATKKTPAKGKGSTALVKKDVGLPQKAAEGVRAITAVDPQALLAQAIDKGMPVESMERLLAMRREMKAEYAREQYFKALSGFQRECPIVGKDRIAKIRSKKGEDSSFAYRYAPLETIVAAAQPVLERWGFSWTCKPSQTATHVKAAVHAHHVDGHEEVTEFEVPLDPTSYMSEPQKAAAASTFARRYAFINAFGITTKGEDSDAQGDQPRKESREPLRTPQEKGPIIYPRADGTASDAVPVHHEVKVELSDYEKGLKYLTATETDPKSKVVVGLFTENEKVDYTHELGEAKDNPEGLAKIIADIVETGKKRRAAVKGVA